MKTNPKTFSLILIGLVFTAMTLLFPNHPGRAFAQLPYQTPTPNEQGTIFTLSRSASGAAQSRSAQAS